MAHSTFGKRRHSKITTRAKQYAVKVSEGQTSSGNQEERKKRSTGVVKEVFADVESCWFGF